MSKRAWLDYPFTDDWLLLLFFDFISIELLLSLILAEEEEEEKRLLQCLMMRRIHIGKGDFALFHQDINPIDYEFFRNHTGAFKRMWAEQVRE